MSKKIIFVGPPGVGKTTLRKIFFEYESAEQLMKYALDPTYGAESIVLNLGQKVGIFDLAGQENEKWLNSNESEIFINTTYIITVVEVSSSIDSILNFINRVVKVRETFCPQALILLLVHKIDLIDESMLKDTKAKLSVVLRDIKKIKIEYTSINKAYFLKTLVVFKNIIKASLDEEIPMENVDISLIKDAMTILQQFQDKKIISFDVLKQSVNLPGARFDETVEDLENKKYIEICRSKDGKKEVKFIFEKGIGFITAISAYFKNKLGIVEQSLERGVISDKEPPQFIGFLLGDADGRTLFTVECEDGVFRRFLGITDTFGVDLISPFISALTSFSKEIKIINMADFKLKGQNSAIYVFEYDQFSFVLFLNKNTDFEPYKSEIQDYFKFLIEKNREVFNKVLFTGGVSILTQIQEESRIWLKKLETSYTHQARGFDIFDIEASKNIYDRLEDYSSNIKITNTALANEIRTLKKRLICAIMEKNEKEIKQISRLTQQIGNKYRKIVR